LQSAIPFLIGTKYDEYANMGEEDQNEITEQARKYARLMKAPLIYCSSKESVNVQKIFKIVLAKCFDLSCNLPKISGIGDPIFEY
jgi:Gtp-binding protein of the ras superfamily involved in termination of M-phase